MPPPPDMGYWLGQKYGILGKTAEGEYQQRMAEAGKATAETREVAPNAASLRALQGAQASNLLSEGGLRQAQTATERRMLELGDEPARMLYRERVQRGLAPGGGGAPLPGAAQGGRTSLQTTLQATPPPTSVAPADPFLNVNRPLQSIVPRSNFSNALQQLYTAPSASGTQADVKTCPPGMHAGPDGTCIPDVQAYQAGTADVQHLNLPIPVLPPLYGPSGQTGVPQGLTGDALAQEMQRRAGARRDAGIPDDVQNTLRDRAELQRSPAAIQADFNTMYPERMPQVQEQQGIFRGQEAAGHVPGGQYLPAPQGAQRAPGAGLVPPPQQIAAAAPSPAAGPQGPGYIVAPGRPHAGELETRGGYASMASGQGTYQGDGRFVSIPPTPGYAASGYDPARAAAYTGQIAAAHGGTPGGQIPSGDNSPLSPRELDLSNRAEKNFKAGLFSTFPDAPGVVHMRGQNGVGGFFTRRTDGQLVPAARIPGTNPDPYGRGPGGQWVPAATDAQWTGGPARIYSGTPPGFRKGSANVKAPASGKGGKGGKSGKAGGGGGGLEALLPALMAASGGGAAGPQATDPNQPPMAPGAAAPPGFVRGATSVRGKGGKGGPSRASGAGSMPKGLEAILPALLAAAQGGGGAGPGPPMAPGAPPPGPPGYAMGAPSVQPMPSYPFGAGYLFGATAVPGQGSGTVDKVPAMLAPHEAVLNRAAADMMGRGRIAALNAQGAQQMGLQRGVR